ncbi:SGNH/GDSL hydrolase family protein [Mycoplasma todarodis]|uniref:Uncharacterized protein n=1 Tax=Mycoplasma todarodis TaxID=1937191 RepID=A0A4R0XVE7_9MOLU|nr:SGNH/GDSL hydrolase family protein [Mycoplasma todarodis]TCG11811.1 hypothetical protein C4B25_00640 [Mycoplasma todarodis]
MKKKTKQVSLGLLAAVSVTVVPIATIISCGNNKTISENQKMMKKYEEEILKHDDDSNKVIDSKGVNLVALGDSVASGYTLLEGITEDKHRGHYDKKTKKVSGISYSSYIARAFQEKNVLSDFDNFAIAGATTSTLAKQLDPKFELSEKEQGTQFQVDFLVDGKEKERFKTIHSKLQKANLVTISIGANDILGQITIGGQTIYDLLLDPSSLSFEGDLNKFIDFGDETKMEKIIEQARLNLIRSIAKIKEINPTTKIVLVGYPMPMNQLAPLLKMMKTDKNGKTIEVAVELLRKLSSISTEISRKFKTVDYVDAYSTSEWDNKSLSLSSELFDIHPGPKGYREMAATILANLNGDGISKEALKSNFSNDGDIEKRLNKDYHSTILKYSEKDEKGNFKETKLEPEAQAVQDKVKPTKLIKFMARSIDLIMEKIITSKKYNENTLPAIETLKSQGVKRTKLLNTIERIKPLILSMMKSANEGYKSQDPKVREAIDQDLKYIFARVVKTIMEKVKTFEKASQDSITNSIGTKATTGAINKLLDKYFNVSMKYLNSNNAKSMRLFKNWISSKQDDVKIIESTLNKGISAFEYTKI